MTQARIAISGRAAHAGVEPEQGRSAVLEAARQTIALHELNGRWPGVSLNVGRIEGGTRPNIVPAAATLSIDLRARTRAEQLAAEAAIEEIVAEAVRSETQATLTIDSRYLPMEHSAATRDHLERAHELAARLGLQVADGATGGASDGNTAASMGIPTLDGLGPVGGARHADGEYIELDSIVPRTAWLAALVLALLREPGSSHEATS